MCVIYGIDLGTTYSCCAGIDEFGRPEVYSNSDNALSTPSVVYFEDETTKNIVVGSSASEAIEPDKVFHCIKRLMGTGVTFDVWNEKYTPQAISSLILKQLIKDAKKVHDKEIKDVVITVPAYFGPNEREATRQAGEMAGLNVLYTIPEPSAAAFDYGIINGESKTVLIYDLGGGTFDATIISINNDMVRNLCCVGRKELGGKNWDETIAQHFASEFEKNTGIASSELMSDPEMQFKLLAEAEKAKKKLTNNKGVRIPINYHGQNMVINFERAVFDELTKPKLNETIDLVEELLNKATEKGVGREQIDEILLVGGSSFMPQVKEALEEKFKIQCRMKDPHLSVAKGAAIFGFTHQLRQDAKEIAAKMFPEQDIKELSTEQRQKIEEAIEENYCLPAGVAHANLKELVNVSAKSFGVVLVCNNGKVVRNLVFKDDEVPVTKTITVPLSKESTSAEICCMENVFSESEVDVFGGHLSLDKCCELGRAELSFGKNDDGSPRTLPAGTAITVSFKLEEDGCLKVTGKESNTNAEVEVEFKGEGIISQAEMDSQKRTLEETKLSD